MDLEDLRKPKWVRYRTTYPLSTNEKDRYFKYDFNDPNILRHYRVEPVEGYNPEYPSIRPLRIPLQTGDLVISRTGR